jgi:hypothetical protein
VDQESVARLSGTTTTFAETLRIIVLSMASKVLMAVTGCGGGDALHIALDVPMGGTSATLHKLL